MLITCPSCGGSFELTEGMGVKATAVCAYCGRVVVVRDTHAVPEGGEHATVPFDPRTQPKLEPVADGETTDVAGAKGGLALPVGKRISLAILSGPRTGDVIRLDRPRVVFGRVEAGSTAKDRAEFRLGQTRFVVMVGDLET